MSLEVELERESYPAHDSLHNGQDPCLNEWKKNVRAHVTALKCHIMASKGLTPEGEITDPYPPDVLLKGKNNAVYIEGVSKESLDAYISDALSKHPERDAEFQSELKLDEVKLNLDDVTDGASSLRKDSIFSVSKAASLAKEELETVSTQSSCATFSTDENDDINNENIENNLEYREIRKELSKKEKEIEKLSKIRDEVENELQDLTANLFQEAHTMVLGANQRAAVAEKSLKEATMQVEVLQAEVSALKALVITSTPSAPNPHLHPQIISRGAQAMVAEAGKIFHRGHKKSPSDFDLKYGRDTTPPSSPLKEGRLFDPATNTTIPLDPDCWEVDPVMHREFVHWRQEPDLCRNNPFMNRVYSEDIDLCLAFPNSTLAHMVQKAIEDNSLYIEEVNPRQKSNCPKKCVLLDVPRYCKYRFRLGDKQDTWYYISHLARNRIISVCDFLSYLRYIQLGLVKSSIHDVYWEIVKLRRQMALARLGF